MDLNSHKVSYITTVTITLQCPDLSIRLKCLLDLSLPQCIGGLSGHLQQTPLTPLTARYASPETQSSSGCTNYTAVTDKVETSTSVRFLHLQNNELLFC